MSRGPQKKNNASVEELRARVAALSPERRQQLIARIRYEKEVRRTTWDCGIPQCEGTAHKTAPVPHARPNQKMPFKRDDGLVGVLFMAGRGWGKTRVGAEAMRKRVLQGRMQRGALIGRTAADVRDVMIEGESGLLNVFPKWERPEYFPSKRKIVFHNGAVAHCFSAEDPDQLRGPQHDFIWGDEVSTWPKMLAIKPETGKPGPEGVLTNAFLGLRLPVLKDSPRAVLTGTPKPTRDMKYLAHTMSEEGLIKVVSGTTYENLDNLADNFKHVILDQYEGTRVGQQELLGLLLKEMEGALLNWDTFEVDNFRLTQALTAFTTITVNVDPAVKSEARNDYTGISVTASDADRRHGYVLYTERFKGKPADAMLRVAQLYDLHMANYVVGEVNNGGDYVQTVLHQLRPDIPFKSVHASVGKAARAEPVAMLYQQQRIHHVGSANQHAVLEEEWTTFVPGEKDQDSPDVMDSVVWGFHDLMVGKQARVIPPARSVRR